MQEASFDSVDGPTAKAILAMLRILTGIKSEDLFQEWSTLWGQPAAVHRTWTNNPLMSIERRHALAKLIATQSDEVQATMRAYCKNQLELPVVSIERSLNDWLPSETLTCPKFIRDATEDDKSLHYLLFRPDSSIDPKTGALPCKVSSMFITFDPLIDALPKFETRRNDGATDKVYRGVIFRNGSDICSVGKVESNPGIRFAKLTPFERKVAVGEIEENRVDLMGIRVGQSERSNRQFAHIIYAYQVTEALEPHFEDILAAAYLEDPSIENALSEACVQLIRQTILAEDLIEGGLQIKKMPGVA